MKPPTPRATFLNTLPRNCSSSCSFEISSSSEASSTSCRFAQRAGLAAEHGSQNASQELLLLGLRGFSELSELSELPRLSELAGLPEFAELGGLAELPNSPTSPNSPISCPYMTSSLHLVPCVTARHGVSSRRSSFSPQSPCSTIVAPRRTQRPLCGHSRVERPRSRESSPGAKVLAAAAAADWAAATGDTVGGVTAARLTAEPANRTNWRATSNSRSSPLSPSSSSPKIRPTSAPASAPIGPPRSGEIHFPIPLPTMGSACFAASLRTPPSAWPVSDRTKRPAALPTVPEDVSEKLLELRFVRDFEKLGCELDLLRLVQRKLEALGLRLPELAGFPLHSSPNSPTGVLPQLAELPQPHTLLPRAAFDRYRA